MIGFKLKTMQSRFFDSTKVISAAGRAKRKVLSRFGAFVRRTAKSSIRKRKKVSPPGKPPTSRTGLLKKFIFFGYVPASDSVVVGPIMLNSKSGDTPRVLELGGKTTVASGLKSKRKKRTVKIAARPYMTPAMDKELPKLPDMWKNSIK